MTGAQPTRPTSITDITLTTPHHDTVVLGNRIEVPTIVVLARYFG